MDKCSNECLKSIILAEKGNNAALFEVSVK